MEPFLKYSSKETRKTSFTSSLISGRLLTICLIVGKNRTNYATYTLLNTGVNSYLFTNVIIADRLIIEL